MRFSVAGCLASIIVFSGIAFTLWSWAVRSPESPWYISRWQEVGEGLYRMEFVSDSQMNILVYRFDPKDFSLRIEHDEASPKRVRTWGSDIADESIVINGAYFLEDYSPAGMLISDGQFVGKQSFDLDKSGVIRFEPDFDIIDTDVQTFVTEDVQEAAQSFPFFIKQGRESIKEDSGLTARRTFIGTDEAGTAYIGTVWRDDVSLYELMQALTEMEVAWYDVINLDGGPSTGIWVETQGFTEAYDSAVPVPNVIVVESRTMQ